MREGTLLTQHQLRIEEENIRARCREKGIVYHYDDAYLLEDKPNGAMLAEYRGVLIQKTPFNAVRIVEVMDWVKLPYGSKKAIEQLTGDWQLRELCYRIDNLIDHPPKRGSNE